MGGLSAWAELPRPVSTALAAATHRLGVRIAPGNRFGVDGAFERFVRLPYALPKEALSEIVERLAQAWDQVGMLAQRRPMPVSAGLIEAI